MKKPFYKVLYIQVLFAIIVGVVLGHLQPQFAVQLKPLGEGFINLIKMMIAPVIFCTVVSGIASVQDIKKVGAKALLYFEVVSTFALALGLLVANLHRPGEGFNANIATLDASSIAQYTTKGSLPTTVEFLMNIIPKTFAGAFVNGDILQVLLIAILFGFALSLMGEKGQSVLKLNDDIAKAMFGIVNIVMKVAPLGALGAMAFVIGKYGIKSLIPLANLVATFYVTCGLFVIIVLGAIAYFTGFSIFRFLAYIKQELLIVLGTSSSESALPSLMEKLQKLGCSKSVVGLVVPTGYSFNLDGTNIYMTLAALFIAQATNTDLTLTQQLTILLVAMLTSKGASGITGAGFITLAATLAVIPTIPVAGMALIFGVDKFMSECRALTNIIGNGVATIVVSKWENELDVEVMKRELG